MKITEILSESLMLETPEQVRSEIIQKISKIQDEPDLVNVLKFTNQYAFKKDVGKLATIKGYRDTVANIILQAIGNVDAPGSVVRAFLKRLSTDGVIKENLLRTPGTVHSIDAIIDTKFLPIFHAIKRDLYEKISGKIGEKGDVGKGEYLLAILSPRIIRRGAPGDVAIDKTKVEIKAGQNGRLGPAGSGDLRGRLDEYFAVLIKQKLATPQILKGVDTRVFNITAKKMGAFSQVFGNDQRKVSAALEIQLKMHYPSLNVKPMVKAIVKGGQIDGFAVVQQMLAASYSVYQKAKGFDGILVIDEDITKFLYINTPEAAAASAGMLSVAFPSFIGSQSDCLKITLRKRT